MLHLRLNAAVKIAHVFPIFNGIKTQETQLLFLNRELAATF